MPGSDRGALPTRDLEHVLDHTPGVWDDIRGGRVLVTGGTGFVGRWMVESLLHANDKLGLRARCVVLTRDADGFAKRVPDVVGHPAVDLSEGDVRTLDSTMGDCSHVLHLATESGPALTPSGSFWTAVLGTRQVLEFATRHGVRKLLYASSGAVYGTQPRDLDRIPEDYAGSPPPTDPATGYGQGKRAAEFLCGVAASEGACDVTIARPFAFVGPCLPLDLNFAIGNFIRDALGRDAISIAGDGTPRRSYLYAADLAIWLWTILVQGASGRAYNVGSEVDVSISDLAALIATTLSPGKPVHTAKPAPEGRPPPRYVPSTQRARTELGLREWIPLDESIRRTAEW